MISCVLRLITHSNILTSGMLHSSNIYIIRVPMHNCNNEFILEFCAKKDGRFRMPTIRNWARIRAPKLCRA